MKKEKQKAETKIKLRIFSPHNYKPSSSIIALTNQFGSLNDLVCKLASLEDLASRDFW